MSPASDPSESPDQLASPGPIPDVVLCPGGPMLVRGAKIVQDASGVDHATTRPVSAICRCGKTARAPWCDGTHKLLPAKQRP